MPAQNLDKQPNYTLKLLNMEPGIPQNRSHQHLVDSEGDLANRNNIREVTMRQWLTIIILCFVNLINYMDRFTLAGILVEVQSYFGIQDKEAGLLQTAFIFTYMLFAPLFGYLGDRYSRRYIMGFGVFLWSITTLLGSFMTSFPWFVMCRALVGIGEASYSTIAPTIISDLFVKDVRSKMLAIFYFAIPVGSGLGYIVGSESAQLFGGWQWSLRVTPILGAIAVVLILFVLTDPERGHSEGAHDLKVTSWREDLKHLVKNPSFMLCTAGFTCVAFVAGALAWWGPKFLYLGIRLQPGSEDIHQNDISYKFGLVAMMAGVMGVPAGSFLAQVLRKEYSNIDPLLCAVALIASSPMVFFACITAATSTVACFCFVFVAQLFLNLTWSVVADILLYVVIPTRRSTAEGFQLLFSHALGDAGSPYLIGIISDALKATLGSSAQENGKSLMTTISPSSANASVVNLIGVPDTQDTVDFRALQYALLITCFIEVLGGIFFLINAIFIIRDREKADRIIREAAENERESHVVINETTESRTLMS